MGGDEPRFRVLHVSNISMSATKEQIYQLFAFIGRIDEFKVKDVTFFFYTFIIIISYRNRSAKKEEVIPAKNATLLLVEYHFRSRP